MLFSEKVFQNNIIIICHIHEVKYVRTIITICNFALFFEVVLIMTLVELVLTLASPENMRR